MMTLPVLALPDFNVPFEIETDASSYGIGATLIQAKWPIAYYSHTWRPYLLGRKFVVKTDQRSLKFLLEQRLIQPQHQKWIAKLLGYSFEVVYKLILENKATDALSQMPPAFHLCYLTAPTLIDLQ
ncbi:transposon Tf2-1 polyprotein isoform X1 [Cucumis melo var. makuwa]|uniref:Transposon Tf2-1 polyprotein isoform X1 n=1 Tax=Cucumis melo var. makuwa TaxID=1194695 RepID=A0A5A7U0J7_CUCMM|nr:transposon Tf2-1 polyprotein isoform X1 [Cucumis melo var. makuwa]TYK07898.1 transposon Tf2-1 polyprotein isoform X1 [Cucumis melo var. makuwa]